MRLYLVQHGEFEAKEVNPERPLTEKGISDVNKIAAFLKETNFKIDTIFHSGERRAQETAKIIVDVVNPQCNIARRDGLSPNDLIEPIVKEIAERKEDLMIVGHLPFLAKLASRLLIGQEEKATVKFCQGGVVCLEKIKGDSWQISWFIIPQLL